MELEQLRGQGPVMDDRSREGGHVTVAPHQLRRRAL
jgi:hypothetical protein